VREHLNLANAVTSVSLVAGFSALLLAIDGQPAPAAALVVVSAVLDGLDGMLARRRGGDHTFGAQLDSLTDLLAFCVVPAVALHVTAPADAGVAGAVLGGAFVLAGAWRLARFALDQKRGHFRGLPTPLGGIAVMGLVLWTPALAALLGTAILAVLMASSVPFPTVPTAAAVVRHGRHGRTRPDRPSRRRRRGRRNRHDRHDSRDRPGGRGGHARRGRYARRSRRGGRTADR